MIQPATPLIVLNNGISIPQLGLGVWQTKDGSEVESAVASALDAGYRLIDTAAFYGNEAGVGNAIRASIVPREEIVVTTKLWNSDHGYDNAIAGFTKSLNKLGLEYIDMYLIHWPVPAKGLFVDTWRALEDLYNAGKIKAIGVCNFQPHHLDELLASATIKPVVNQIELHPYFPQTELREYGKLHDIEIESWSPIGGTGGILLAEPILLEIGNKYDKSPAQVVIRWHLQNGLIVIPKSVHADRIRKNFDVYNFELSQEDMLLIDSLQTGIRVGPDPDKFN